MCTRRTFHHLRFPWRFNDRTPFLLVPLTATFEEEVQPLKEGFKFAIAETIHAIAEEDHATLQRVLEPRLYTELADGLNTLRRRGHQLTLVNPEATAYTYVYNEAVYFGPHVDRSQNAESLQHMEAFKGMWRSQRIPKENIYIYANPQFPSHLILKLDVVFNSACKFVLHDERQELITGEDNKSSENHKFRFECFVERPAGLFNQFTGMIALTRYFMAGRGSSPVPLENWFITDIDDFLPGNPFTPPKD